jgi:hypothetical protein
MNPVGLTRAEESKGSQDLQQPTSAPPGVTRCVAALPPDGKMCGAAATCRIVWPDREAPNTPACAGCAERLALLGAVTRVAPGLVDREGQISTKDHPGQYSCLDKVHPDEPIFVLRANDPVAPTAVRLWAAQYWQQSGDPKKVAEARTIADAMEAWLRARSTARDGSGA